MSNIFLFREGIIHTVLKFSYFKRTSDNVNFVVPSREPAIPPAHDSYSDEGLCLMKGLCV